MAATMSTTLGQSSRIHGHARTVPTVSSRPWGAAAGLGILVTLLIAMAPGMSQVAFTTGVPQPLEAPLIRIAASAEIVPVTASVDPTPQPGPPAFR